MNNKRKKTAFFPDAIIENILSRLPIKPLLRFRSVCKSWDVLTRDHPFISLHLDRSKKKTNDFKLMLDDEQRDQLPKPFSLDLLQISVEVNFSDIRVYGSCNGLLLLCRGRPESIPRVCEQLWLWNPSTREKRELPIPPSDYIDGEADDIHYGLGYSESSKDYKIVRIRSIVVTRELAIPAEITVFSLQRNTWTRVPNTGDTKHVPYIFIAIDSTEGGVFMNGALHWIAVDIDVDGKNVGWEDKHIISFNIDDESIGEVPFPFSNGKECEFVKLRSFYGNLCMVSYSEDDCDAWVVKDYGSRESWSELLSIKKYTMQEYHDFHPLLFTKKDDVILIFFNGSLHNMCNLKYKSPEGLCKFRRHWYRDPPEGPDCGCNNLLKGRVVPGYHQATLYVESLVPLYVAGGSEEEGLEEKENFYLFSKEKFRVHTTSQEGNIRVLERFIHELNVLDEAENYGLTFIEACPYTAMIPHRWNVDAFCFVLGGNGAVTLVQQGINKETYKLKRGDIFRVYSGTTLYMINGDNSKNLHIAVLTRFNIINKTPNQFQTSTDHLRNLFEGQMNQGPFLKVSQEQIHALHGFSSKGKSQSNKLLNLLYRSPSLSSQFGRLYETTSKDIEQLQDKDIAVSFAQITRGSKFVPYCNSKSTTIVLVVNGIGCFGISCLKGKKCGCRQSSATENRTGQVSRGDVVVVPGQHCIILQAPEDQNVDVVYFEVNAYGNKRYSLVQVSDQFQKGSTSLIVPEEDLAALKKKMKEEGIFFLA